MLADRDDEPSGGREYRRVVPRHNRMLCSAESAKFENGPAPEQGDMSKILDEIRRRTVGDAGGPPIPVRVNGILHTPDGWTSTP